MSYMNNNDHPNSGRILGTVIRWAIVIALAVLALSAIFGALGFFGSWASQPARIFGVENVRATWQFAYDREEDLKAAARLACDAQARLTQVQADKSFSQQQRDQSFSDLRAREQSYERQRSEYDSVMRNKLEGGLVAPSDVRQRALPLNEAKDTYCSR